MPLTDVAVPTTTMGDTEVVKLQNGDFEDLTNNWPDHWTVLEDEGQAHTWKEEHPPIET